MKSPKEIAILIAKKNKPEKVVQESMEESDDVLEMAAEDIMAALEAKDAEQLAEALKTFMDACGPQE